MMGQQLGETKPDLIISYAELMAFVAFATQRGAEWRGRLVLFATDNGNVESWVRKWGPRPRAARYLIRVLRYLQAKFGFEVLVAYVRTYHNVTADLITRTDEAGYQRMCQRKGLRHLDVRGAWDEMVQRAPSEAGVVTLFHLDAEDANIATQLRASRVARLQEDRPLPELPRLIEVRGHLGQWALAWQALGGEARVQFRASAEDLGRRHWTRASGGATPTPPADKDWKGAVVAASLGPDPRGREGRDLLLSAAERGARGVLFDLAEAHPLGPLQAAAKQLGWDSRGEGIKR